MSVISAAWIFGAVQPWVQLISLAAALVACVFALPQPYDNEAEQKFPIIGWLVLLMIMLGAFQLVALQPSQLQWLSSRSLELRQEFGQDVSQPHPLSIDPSRTREALGLTILSMLVFSASFRCITRRTLSGVLVILAVNGAAIGVYGIWQIYTGESEMFGSVEMNETSFGPFVNRNNAAGYLLCGLAAALGGLLCEIRAAEIDYGRELKFHEHFNPSINPLGFVAGLSGILITIGILLTASRGGSLALVVAALTAVCVGLSRRRLKLALGVFAVVVILAVATVVAAPAALAPLERVGGVTDASKVSWDGRIEIWKSSLGIGRDFWLTGSGQGTFRDVFQVYDEASNGTMATHAENHFIEMFTSMGVSGGFIFLLIVVFAGIKIARLMAGSDGYLRIVGITGLFFLVSQLVACTFDFGLSIPANMIAVSFLSGSLLAVAGSRSEEEELEATSDRRIPLLGKIPRRETQIIIVILAFLAFFVGKERMSASSVEFMPIDAVAGESNSRAELKLAALQRQTERIQSHITRRWDDSRAHFALAESYVAGYELSGDQSRPNPPVSDLAKVIKSLRIADRQDEAEALLESTGAQPSFMLALTHLRHARDGSCLNRRVHARLHDLEAFDMEQPITNDSYERAVRLWEGTRYNAFMNGLAAYESEDFDAAFLAWKPCCETNSLYKSRVIELATDVAPLEKLCGTLFPTTLEFLTELAEKHFDAPEDRELRDRAIQLISSSRASEK